MAEGNQYGEFIRFLLNAADVRVGALADRLGYDITYVSKWLTGSRLPSERATDHIHKNMAEFFAGQLSSHPNQQIIANIIGHHYNGGLGEAELREALDAALFQLLCLRYAESASSVKGLPRKSLEGAFLFKKPDIIALMKSAVLKAANSKAKKIEILSSVDLYRIFGDQLVSLFEQCSLMNLSASLDQVVDLEVFRGDKDTYFDHVIKTFSVANAPKVTLFCNNGPPSGSGIIVIKGVAALQLALEGDGILSCCYSYEDEVTAALSEYCSSLFRRLPRFLFPLNAQTLVKTNTWIDFYTQKDIQIFICGAPALFLPPEVIDELIESVPAQEEKDIECRVHLKMLSRIWEQKTRHSSINIILFKSCLLEYLQTGNLYLEQRKFTLTAGQRAAHVNHLDGILQENPGIRIRMIDDIASSVHQLRYGVSFFASSSEVIFEKAILGPSTQFCYHKLGHMEDIELFRQYFEQVAANRYVIDTGTEDLLDYMRFSVSLSEEFSAAKQSPSEEDG